MIIFFLIYFYLLNVHDIISLGIRSFSTKISLYSKWVKIIKRRSTINNVHIKLDWSKILYIFMIEDIKK